MHDTSRKAHKRAHLLHKEGVDPLKPVAGDVRVALRVRTLTEGCSVSPGLDVVSLIGPGDGRVRRGFGGEDIPESTVRSPDRCQADREEGLRFRQRREARERRPLTPTLLVDGESRWCLANGERRLEVPPPDQERPVFRQREIGQAVSPRCENPCVIHTPILTTDDIPDVCLGLSRCPRRNRRYRELGPESPRQQAGPR